MYNYEQLQLFGCLSLFKKLSIVVLHKFNFLNKKIAYNVASKCSKALLYFQCVNQMNLVLLLFVFFFNFLIFKFGNPYPLVMSFHSCNMIINWEIILLEGMMLRSCLHCRSLLKLDLLLLLSHACKCYCLFLLPTKLIVIP